MGSIIPVPAAVRRDSASIMAPDTQPLAARRARFIALPTSIAVARGTAHRSRFVSGAAASFKPTDQVTSVPSSTLHVPTRLPTDFRQSSIVSEPGLGVPLSTNLRHLAL